MTGEHEIVAKAGAEEDSIHIRKVEEANPDYVMGEIKDVINWFDDEPYKLECYSIKDKMSEIKASPKAGAILAELMAQAPGAESRGDVAESVKEQSESGPHDGKNDAGKYVRTYERQYHRGTGEGLKPHASSRLKRRIGRPSVTTRKNVKKRRHIREFGLNRDEPFSLLTTALYFYSDNRSVTSRMPSGRKRRNNFREPKASSSLIS